MDFLFLEFYIQKKYNQKVEEYFRNKVSIDQDSKQEDFYRRCQLL